MKDEKRRERLAALFGLELPVEPPPPTYANETASREAEAVIAYLDTPTKFAKLECRECSQEFAVSRANVAYCSDHCRARYLESIGIEWDWTKPPDERWGLKEPLVVPPQALALVEPLVPQQEATA